jgi:exosortase E/protease (VPEID-CTERM system)
MMRISPIAMPVSGLRPSVPIRLALICGLFFADKIVLSAFVDFDRAQAAQGLGAIVRIMQHWGFRFLVALAAAMAVFAYVRDGQRLRSVGDMARAYPVRSAWLMVHVLLLLPLVPLSYLLYRDGPSPLPFGAVALLWTVIASVGALAAFAAMAPWAIWKAGSRALGIIWVYAAVAALIAASAMQLSQRLWGPASEITFDLVQRLLTPILPGLSVDTANLVLRTDRFAVQISEVCSGLEGVGLMLAFCSAWLLYFRRDYYFPRALLIIPVGVLIIFALNVLRIAALMLIGDAGYPSMAAYGFHSQAGWISFNAAACGLIYATRRSAWLNRKVLRSGIQEESDNPTAAFVMPLLAILVAGTISHAMASNAFQRLDPLRLIAGMVILAVYRRKLSMLDWRCSWRGPLVGVCVFLVWIAAARHLLTLASMPRELASLTVSARGTWVVSRVAASVLIVPVAEELAYRGFLMRRIGNRDFESVPYRSVSWLALFASSVAFGVVHGAMWLPAIVAGLAYGLILVRRASMGEAVIAHATTNALIAVAVLFWGQWQLWS